MSLKVTVLPGGDDTRVIAAHTALLSHEVVLASPKADRRLGLFLPQHQLSEDGAQWGDAKLNWLDGQHGGQSFFS